MNRISILLLLLSLLVTWSCEKEGNDFVSHPQPTPVLGNEATVMAGQATTSWPTKPVALIVLYSHLHDQYFPISISQIAGKNQTQFKQWLSSNILITANQSFAALINDPDSEFIIIKDVKSRATGKFVTLGLISVPSKFTNQYDAAVVLEAPQSKITVPTRLCTWKRCSPYNQCITWTKPIPTKVNCPTNQCNNQNPCKMPFLPPLPGTTIGVTLTPLGLAIAAF